MKNLLFAFCVSVLFFNCNSDATPDNFESKLFECYAHEFKGYGHEIDQTILDFENFLLENKILKNNSAGGYADLVKALTAKDIIVLGKPIPTILLDKLFLIADSSPHCIKDKMEDPEFLNSRYAKMLEGREAAMEKLKKSESPNAEEMRKERLNLFTKEDLKQPFYKIRFILDIAAKQMSTHLQKENRLRKQG